MEDVKKPAVKGKTKMDVDETPKANSKKRPAEESPAPKEAKKPKSAERGTPFRRIIAEEVEFEHDALKKQRVPDCQNAYGLKAHQDLITKKKRGSYKGGHIDGISRSFKFANDSD
ncbi:hypothetical protein BC829DRAFT_393352 [Chytridium lagenaria]|nr:hypothetical protein BC829DRAFT_393352 [Chytridium lagenaria]